MTSPLGPAASISASRRRTRVEVLKAQAVVGQAPEYVFRSGPVSDPDPAPSSRRLKMNRAKRPVPSTERMTGASASSPASRYSASEKSRFPFARIDFSKAHTMSLNASSAPSAAQIQRPKECSRVQASGAVIARSFITRTWGHTNANRPC